MSINYRVCNRPLDIETDRHCEFDGEVRVAIDGTWYCPACKTKRKFA
jgi:rubredoxin